MHLSAEEIINIVKPIVSKHETVSLAYLFGSSITGDTGPLSDYDFAFYLTNNKDSDYSKTIDPKIVFETQSMLISEISIALKTDKVDVVILNNSNLGSEIKFDVISQGILFHEVEPYKVIVEPQIMNEYYDFKMFLKLNTL